MKIIDGVKAFIEYYRMPEKYLPEIEDINLFRIAILGAVTATLAIINLIVFAIAGSFIPTISDDTSLSYFVVISLIGLIAALIAKRMWKSKVHFLIKRSFCYLIILISIMTCTHNSFLSANPVNGYMAFIVIYIVSVFILNMEPIRLVLVASLPGILVIGRIHQINGLTTMLNALLVAGFNIYLTFYRRKYSKRDYIQRDQLNESYHAVQAADQAKSAFLAHMSHEIRTPINAIMGMDEMILRENVSETVAGYAFSIQKATNNLLALINDILDFSKIEEGRLEIMPIEYNVDSFLNDCYSMIAQRAESKGLEFSIETDPGLPSVLKGDELRVRQIALNFLTNAVKYTREGSVLLRLDYEKTENNKIDLMISVRDTGEGIKAEDIPKLFMSFERVDEVAHRNIEGTGLGLSITKKLIDAQNGSIQIDSMPGEGSTFTARIPQSIVDDSPIGFFKPRDVKPQGGVAVYRERFHAPDARILIVDDVKMNLDVFCALLNKTKMTIDVTTSGENAVEMAKNTKYDLIFIDQMMPHMDGEAVLHAINDDEESVNRNTTKIVITANLLMGVDKKYREAGFDDYVPKPIESAKLEKMILEYLPQEKVSREIITEDAEDDIDYIDALPKIDGINWREAYERLQDMDILLETVRMNARDAEKTVDVIRRYYDAYIETKSSDALDNYRIKVHALKGCAGTIGASEMQAKAKELEYAAKDSDYDTILKKTEGVLSEWISLCDEINSAMAVEEAETGTEEITDIEGIIFQLEAVAEAMEIFDIDSANDKLRDIGKYKFDDNVRQKIDIIKEAVNEIDDEKTAEEVKCTVQILREQFL